MNLKKAILTSLVLAAMGMFLAGCECNECPIRKLFGAKSAQSQSEKPSAPEAPPAAK